MLQKWSKGKMKEKVNNLVLFDKVRLAASGRHSCLCSFWRPGSCLRLCVRALSASVLGAGNVRQAERGGT